MAPNPLLGLAAESGWSWTASESALLAYPPVDSTSGGRRLRALPTPWCDVPDALRDGATPRPAATTLDSDYSDSVPRTGMEVTAPPRHEACTEARSVDADRPVLDPVNEPEVTELPV